MLLLSKNMSVLRGKGSSLDLFSPVALLDDTEARQAYIDAVRRRRYIHQYYEKYYFYK